MLSFEIHVAAGILQGLRLFDDPSNAESWVASISKDIYYQIAEFCVKGGK